MLPEEAQGVWQIGPQFPLRGTEGGSQIYGNKEALLLAQDYPVYELFITLSSLSTCDKTFPTNAPWPPQYFQEILISCVLERESQTYRVKWLSWLGCLVARSLLPVVTQLLWYFFLGEMNLRPGGEREHFWSLNISRALISRLFDGVYWLSCLLEGGRCLGLLTTKGLPDPICVVVGFFQLVLMLWCQWLRKDSLRPTGTKRLLLLSFENFLYILGGYQICFVIFFRVYGLSF